MSHEGLNSEPAEDREGPGLRPGRYLRLGLVGVAVALVVIIVVVLLTPLDEPPPPGSAVVDTPQDAVDTVARVTLATNPLEVNNEALQAELLAVIGTLQTRFPANAHALHVVASAYDKLHQTTKAEEAWEKCVALDRSSAGPRLGLAAMLSRKGEDARAIDLLEQALEDGVQSAELYYRLANAHANAGEVERGERVMQQGVAAFPNVAINWLQLGRLQNQLQMFEQAEQSLRKSLELDMQTSEVYFALANACQRQGKSDEAVAYRQQFDQAKSQEMKANEGKSFQEIYQQSLRPVTVGTLVSAAAIYAQIGDADKAEELFLRANVLEPDNTQVLEELASFYRKQNRIGDARVVQQRLVDLRPEDPFYRINLASLAGLLEDWPAAHGALEKAIQLRPDLPLGYIGLAQVQLKLGELDAARQNAERALQRGPTADTYALLAIICQQQGDQQGANAARQAASRLTQPPK